MNFEIIERAGFVGQVEQQGDIQPIQAWTFGVPFWRRCLRFLFLSLKWWAHYPPIHAFVRPYRDGPMGNNIISIDFGCYDLAGARVYTIGLRALLKLREMNSLWHWDIGRMGVFNLCCVCPDLLPSDQHFLYFEAAGVIITGLIWAVYESRAKGQAGAAIERLIGLQPQTAWIKTEDGFPKPRLIRSQKAHCAR